MTLAEFGYSVYDLCYSCSQNILFTWLSNLSIVSVPDEGYSRNASCALNLDIYVFIIKGFLTKSVPLVEQEQLTLPEHLSSLSVFSSIHVTQSVCFLCSVYRLRWSFWFIFLLDIVLYIFRFFFWLPF